MSVLNVQIEEKIKAKPKTKAHKCEKRVAITLEQQPEALWPRGVPCLRYDWLAGRGGRGAEQPVGGKTPNPSGGAALRLVASQSDGLRPPHVQMWVLKYVVLLTL